MSQATISEICIARESEGSEFAGRLHGIVRFTPEFRQKTDGRRCDLESARGERWSGVARFRGDELWLTEIEPVKDELEDGNIDLRADGLYVYNSPVLTSTPRDSHHHGRGTGKRAQRRMNKPWAWG